MAQVTLKKITTADADEVYASVAYSRPALGSLLWAASATEDSVYDYIAHTNADRNTIYAIRTEDDSFAGLIELRDFNWHYQVGYWLDARFRGLGLATNALKQLIEQADRAIVAQVRIGNLKSNNVMQRAGMHLVFSDTVWFYYSSLVTGK